MIYSYKNTYLDIFKTFQCSNIETIGKASGLSIDITMISGEAHSLVYSDAVTRDRAYNRIVNLMRDSR